MKLIILFIIPFTLFAYDLKKIETDSRKKIFKGDGRFHHPINEKMEKKIKLPLKKGKLIHCTTCHLEHKKSDAGKYLRMGYRKLCTECHIEKDDGNFNHIDLKKDKKSPKKMVEAKTCSTCHFMHNSMDKKLIRVKGHRLCITCHTDKKKFHRKHLTLPQIARINGFELEDKKITCLNCHKIHGARRKTSYLKEKQDILKLCSNCHGKKASGLLKIFHKKHR